MTDRSEEQDQATFTPASVDLGILSEIRATIEEIGALADAAELALRDGQIAVAAAQADAVSLIAARLAATWRRISPRSSLPLILQAVRGRGDGHRARRLLVHWQVSQGRADLGGGRWAAAGTVLCGRHGDFAPADGRADCPACVTLARRLNGYDIEPAGQDPPARRPAGRPPPAKTFPRQG